MRLPISAVAVLTLLVAADAQVKPSAAIPATAPTQSVSNLPSAQPLTSTTHIGKSAVIWKGSALSVDAGGDSLRTILRQVSRATGMKVTGGVPDEQVFGTYGPGPIGQVVTALFSGLSVNLMLISDSPTHPEELVLTARTGGPTPPSAAQPLSATDDPAEVNMAQPRPGRHTSPDSFVQPSTQEQTGVSAAGPTVPLNDNGNGTSSATDANGQPQSPNGVRTPEQIFEELRKRQAGNTATQ